MDLHVPRLREQIKNFEGVRVLVLGDVMLDYYWHGRVERISPEAPVPVVEVERTEAMPGGAANVALNLRALGAEVALAGLCGRDENGERLQGLLRDNSIRDYLLPAEGRPTTTKIRIMGNGVQMLRLDREETAEPNNALAETILAHVRHILENGAWQAVVLQDYDKGFLSAPLIRRTVQYCREQGLPLIADPKKRHFWDYNGVALFKPNLKELLEAFSRSQCPRPDDTDIQRLLMELRRRMPHGFTMLTLGAQGLWLASDKGVSRYPARERHVRDVSGAGDTVAAVAALCIATGVEPETMAVLCNLAGGRVCEEPGVAVISRPLLEMELDMYSLFLQEKP
jgi:rfaE bifunctional protein kinase chain/domain